MVSLCVSLRMCVCVCVCVCVKAFSSVLYGCLCVCVYVCVCVRAFSCVPHSAAQTRRHSFLFCALCGALYGAHSTEEKTFSILAHNLA